MKKEQLKKVIDLLKVFIEMEEKSGFFSSLLCEPEIKKAEKVKQ